MRGLLDIYTISFFGHRYLDSAITIETRLENLVIKLLYEHEYVDFLIGRNGEFDQLVSSTIKRVKKEYRDDNCAQILVLPYNTAEYQNNETSFVEYYDEIEICPESSLVHFKNAIQVRNRKMIEQSDLCIFYVEYNYGGAYQSMKYAVKQNKRIINIANSDLFE